MLKIAFSFLLSLVCYVGFSQSVLYFRADTIKFKKNGGTTELLLQNTTKDTLGIAVNVGDGLIKFMKPYKLNDSTIVVGLDTLTLSSGGGGQGDTTNYIATYYRLYKVADSLMALVNVAGDSWGTQTVVSTAYLRGSGIDGDSLSVNLDSFYTKYQVDSIAAALSLAGGADGIGPVGVIHDSTLLHTGKAGDSLRVHLGIVAGRAETRKAIDSIAALITPGLSSNSTGILTNSNVTVPTDLTVQNAIDALTAGTAFPGWVVFSGVSDATFTTGTSNSTAWRTALNAVQSGGTIYIPRGDYYFSSSIAIPSTKRIRVIVDGNCYFRTGNGFVIDGFEQYVELNGRILGTNQEGVINYGSQTNIGVWLRNTTNSEVHIAEILGFKYAIQGGGFASGTSTEQGTQHNRVYFRYLRRNSVAIYLHPSGGTTSGRGNWCNGNDFYCGQISGDTALIMRKDVTQLDRFNGNTFYSFRPEHGGSTNISMKLAIYMEYAVANNFIGGRFESGDITEKLYATNDVDNTHFDGFDYWAVQWLANPGNNISINGPIYDQTSGICVGMSAMGYRYSSTSTFFNKRVRVFGTTRSPSAMANLPSNIDVEYTNETSALVTTITYTVLPGIRTVKVNYTSGTAIITLPIVSANPDRRVVVKNLHASNSVTVFGPTSGEPVSIGPHSAVEYEASGGVWISISSKGTITPSP